MRELTYYVGVSLDGFVAGPDDDVSAFPAGEDVLGWIGEEYPETLPTHARAALGVDAPNRHFDTVVMGRRTYAPALDLGITSPYAHLRQHVVSTTLTSPDVAVTVESDPVALVRRLKGEDGAGIWLAGGGRLAGSLVDEVDVLVLKIYPVLLGGGTALFEGVDGPRALVATGSHDLVGGTTVRTYRRAAA